MEIEKFEDVIDDFIVWLKEKYKLEYDFDDIMAKEAGLYLIEYFQERTREFVEYDKQKTEEEIKEFIKLYGSFP